MGPVDGLGSDACTGSYLQHNARSQMEEEWYLMILGTPHTLQMVCLWPLLTGWAPAAAGCSNIGLHHCVTLG